MEVQSNDEINIKISDRDRFYSTQDVNKPVNKEELRKKAIGEINFVRPQVVQRKIETQTDSMEITPTSVQPVQSPIDPNKRKQKEVDSDDEVVVIPNHQGKDYVCDKVGQ